MGILIGLVVTLGCVLGGFMAMGGHLNVLVQPWEAVIICGAAFGTFLVANPIATVKDTWGSLYGVGACALTKTVKEHPDLTRAYAQALRKVTDWMKANPDKAAEMMSKSTGGKVPAAEFAKYLKSTTYEGYSQNADLKTQAAAMKAFGSLERVPKGAEDFYAYPADAGAKW